MECSNLLLDFNCILVHNMTEEMWSTVLRKTEIKSSWNINTRDYRLCMCVCGLRIK